MLKQQLEERKPFGCEFAKERPHLIVVTCDSISLSWWCRLSKEVQISKEGAGGIVSAWTWCQCVGGGVSKGCKFLLSQKTSVLAITVYYYIYYYQYYRLQAAFECWTFLAVWLVPCMLVKTAAFKYCSESRMNAARFGEAIKRDPKGKTCQETAWPELPPKLRHSMT